MDLTPGRPYMGPTQYSYIPEGLVSHVAPTPGSLCSRCSALDIPGYFIEPGTETLIYDAEHSLGPIDDIINQSSCSFCELVVVALRVKIPELFSDVRTSLPTMDNRPVMVYLISAVAGSFYLGSQYLGSTFLGSDFKQDVSCMVIYTNALFSTSVITAGRDRAFVRLLANDAHLLGQYPMYHGRLIGNHVFPSLLWSWIQTCRDHHTLCNQIRRQWGAEQLSGPRSLRHVDTEKMCLTKWHFFSSSYHVTLSYVWGGSQGLQLTKANQSAMFEKDALSHVWQSIPAVIRDAIELVRDLNALDKRNKIVLWVDQLCVVQDDPEDKAIQIEQMGQTYSTAIAALVATEGIHSNVQISRHHPHSDSLVGDMSTANQSGKSSQMVRNIGGLRLVVALPNISQTLEKSAWNTRAWTMQEAELSHSSVIFGADQVHFRCAEAVFREDMVSEIPELALKEIERTGEKWFDSQTSERRRSPTKSYEWPLTFDMYTRIVESYTARHMTFATDILAAFKGILGVMHAISAWKMHNGLIEDVMDFALLWRPNGIVKRRFQRNGDPQQHPASDDLGLPTYAWSAWHGPVVYQAQSSEFKSLIHPFEISTRTQKRRVVRFSQHTRSGSVGVFNLEPTFPYAPQDCSTYEDISQGWHWAKPQARSLAYRMRLVNNPHVESRDGPAILHFKVLCAKLVLSTVTASSAHHNASSEGCRRAWLLDQSHRRVGTVWHVPLLDELDNKSEVDIIFLSQNKSSSETADGWLFDPTLGAWDEWCFFNVMVIKNLPASGLAERLTIGMVHARCADDAQEEIIHLA